MDKVAEMMRINQNTGEVKHLSIYENRAVMKNEKSKEMIAVYYKPENVNYKAISDAECMLIDDILFGFDLSDYFGDDYNIVIKSE